MKKTVIRLFAIMALTMGMTFTSCEKTPENNDPNNPGTENPDDPGTTSTIVANNFSTPQVISSEGSVAIEGNELMISAYQGTALLEAYGGVAILTTPDDGYDYDKVILLNEGDEIGSTGHFTQDNSADLYSDGVYTTWANKTGYAGISFKKNGQTVYGWVKLSVDAATTKVTIYGYAYEATAGKTIKAGKTK